MAQISVAVENAVVGEKYYTKTGFEVQILSIDPDAKQAIAMVIARGEKTPIQFGYVLTQNVPDAPTQAPINSLDDVRGVAAKPGFDDTLPVGSTQEPKTVSGNIAPAQAEPAAPVPAAAAAAPPGKPAKPSKKKKAAVDPSRPLTPAELAIKKNEEEAKRLKEEVKRLRLVASEEKRAQKMEKRERIARAKSMTGVRCIDKDVELAKLVMAGMPYADFVARSGVHASRRLTEVIKRMSAGKCRAEITPDIVRVNIVRESESPK